LRSNLEGPDLCTNRKSPQKSRAFISTIFTLEQKKSEPGPVLMICGLEMGPSLGSSSRLELNFRLEVNKGKAQTSFFAGSKRLEKVPSLKKAIILTQ